jgi:hypothetical protein
MSPPCSDSNSKSSYKRALAHGIGDGFMFGHAEDANAPNTKMATCYIGGGG